MRGPGPTELTEAGRILASAAQRTREAFTRVLGEVKSRDETLAGEVSLTTVEGLLPLVSAPLAALTKRHPEISVRLHLGDSGPSVRRREVDVSIGVMQVMHRPPPGCWGRRLFPIRYGVFGTELAMQAPLRWVVLDASLAQTPEAVWGAKHDGSTRSGRRSATGSRGSRSSGPSAGVLTDARTR